MLKLHAISVTRSNIILELLYLHVLWNIKDLKWCPTTNYHAIKLWYNYIIVTNMEGNIRIYRLPKGLGTDRWKWYYPSRRRVKYHLHGPYHDPSLSCLWHYNSIWFDTPGYWTRYIFAPQIKTRISTRIMIYSLWAIALQILRRKRKYDVFGRIYYHANTQQQIPNKTYQHCRVMVNKTYFKHEIKYQTVFTVVAVRVLFVIYNYIYQPLHILLFERQFIFSVDKYLSTV